MKRFFFTAIALAAVAIGCTKSGLLESPQTYEDPISFEPYTGKAPVTKATVENNETIKKGFRVIGFIEGENAAIEPSKPYLRKMVYGTDGLDESGNSVVNWDYDGSMFWPDKETLSFVAYGLNVNGTPEVNDEEGADYGDAVITGDDIFKMNGTDYTSFIYEVPDERRLQKDLVISPKIAGRNSGTVEVTLYHVLSRIGFSVNVENNTNDKPAVEITGIELTGNFITNGTFDLNDAVTVSNSIATYKVNGTPELKTYSFYGANETKFSTSETGKQQIHAGNANDRYLMIIPTGEDGIGEGAQVKVTYTIGGIEQEPAILPLAETFPLLAGKAYEFVFSLSTVAVGFNVDMTDWTPGFTDDGNNEHTPGEGYFPLN